MSRVSKGRSGKLWRAWATMAAERSTPSTWAPDWAISAVRGPVPQPASRMRSPGWGARSEKVAAELPDEGVRSVVEFGVPVRRHLPIVAAAARHGNGPILARLLENWY